MSPRRRIADVLDALDGAGRVGVFTATLAVAALSLYLATPHLPGPAVQPGLPWWLIGVGFVVTEIFVVHVQVRRQHHSFSLSEIPLVLGLFFLHPMLLLPVRLLGSFVALAGHRRLPVLKLFFNLSSFAAEVGVALVVFRVALGAGEPLGPRGWLAAALATVATALIGAMNVTAAMSLYEGVPAQGVRRLLTSAVVGASCNTSLAVVCVTLLAADGRAGILVAGLTIILYVVYQSYAGLLRRHESLELIHGFTRTVGTSLDVEPTIRQLLSEARTVVKSEIAELTLLHPDGSAIRTRLEGDDELTVTQIDGADRDSAAWRAVLDGGQPVRIGRGGLPPVAQLEERGIDDALVAPLRSEGGVIGKILVGNRLGRVIGFDDADLRLFDAMANHASVVLQNGRLVEQLRREAAATAHQAKHDALTGLPNRTFFHDRVEAAIDETGPVAVLLIDLDRFKEVNDTLGHHNGDELLQEVGRRLRASVRSGDTVARLGGDEFAVLLPGVAAVEAAVATASGLTRVLERPFTLSDVPIEVGASVGIALAPIHGTDAVTLLQRADVAMYQAKGARTRVEVYNAANDQYSPERLGLVSELRRAIDGAGGLEVNYQLKGDLQSGEIIGAEALLRWQHPTRGFIPPDDFVPMAEHTGLIRGLTHRVLREAVRQCAEWRRRGLDVGVAVNISVRDLLDPSLPTLVRETLDRHGVPAQSLTLELTESVVMSDPARTIGLLDALAAMGVDLAVDDFGTGYSSLSYLKRLPVREIKIDRSFVRDMGLIDSDAAIVQSVVDLGRNLGLRVVAEGVEDEASWRRLSAMGCSEAQGYWLARPAPAADVDAWLDRGVHGMITRRIKDTTVVPMRTRAMA